MVVKLSTLLPYTGPLSTPETLVSYARAIEDLGYTYGRVGEHILYPSRTNSRYPYSANGTRVIDTRTNQLEMFTLFAFLAGQTSQLRFQSGVMLAALRSPFVTAREIATLDYLSGGRLCIEVGVGWMKDEFDALGVPFERRGEITDEALRIFRHLFEGEDGPWEGKRYRLPAVNFAPRPVQRPFAIHVGGGIAHRVLERVAEFGRGWTPIGVTREQVVGVMPVLESLLRERGRTLKEIEIQGVVSARAQGTRDCDVLVRQIELMKQSGFSCLQVDVGVLRSDDSSRCLSALARVSELVHA